MNLKKKNTMGAWSGQEQGSSYATLINSLVFEFPSLAVVFVTRYSNYIFTQQQIHQLQY